MKKLVLQRETVRLLTDAVLERAAGGETDNGCPIVCGSYPHTSCGGTSSYCRPPDEGDTYYTGCQTWIY